MNLASRVNVALSFAALIWLNIPAVSAAAPDSDLTAGPHNAFTKVNREDLLTPLRARGEVRVIIGLETQSDQANRADRTADDVKEQRINARQERVLRRLARQNIRELKRLRHHPFMAATVDAQALDALLADPEVTSVAEDRPNYPVLQDTPHIVRADTAWAEGYRGAGQTVVVLDTGMDQTHPFFIGKVLAEACFSRAAQSNTATYTSYCPAGAPTSTAAGSGSSCPDSNLGCWHGTHVAGIAVGRYGLLNSTTGGIANEANLIPIQVFQRRCDATGCSITAFDSDILKALDYVYSLRNTYNIASVNMSLGGQRYNTTCDATYPAYQSVIASLRAANIATVIAAGNDGDPGAISAPACVSNAISVGSTTKQNAISSFSNSASFLSLLAPGSFITSALPGGGYGVASGTSMATPHVAGTWALLKSAKPTATVDELLAALQARGTPITDARNDIVKPLVQIGSVSDGTGALGMMMGNARPIVDLSAALSAPNTVDLSATASDPDASITKVEFYRDSTLIATVTTAVGGSYRYTDSNLAVGTYSYTAKAYDNATPAGITTSASRPVAIVSATGPTVNVAAQASGGIATASTTYSSAFDASGAINGDRKGINWGNNGGWNDATANAGPDWLQVNFAGTYTISEIDVFTLQDNYGAPSDPTTQMPFTQYGITDFRVQYLSNGAWVDVPGGTIAGNNLVWRRIAFTPVSTNAVRVLVTGALNSYARITEVEAWTGVSSTNASTINVAAQANGGVATASTAYSAAYPASATNNGDRKGLNWGNGGGWNDATANAFPDWVQVSFNGTYTIGEIGVFTVQDNYAAPVDPTANMSFTQFGITDFRVQYLSNGTWVDVPGGSIAGNNLVWRRIAFAPITTTAIRVLVSGALNGYARITEIEAWTAGDATALPAPASMNVAAQSNGGIAAASSSYSAAFSPAGANNGDRRGLNWGAGGGWNDATDTAFPDWLQVTFNATYTVGEVDVFTVQDNYATPTDPTSDMTFTQWGITDFRVQYFSNGTWVDVPGGTITGNNLVWRRIVFSPVATSAIRVLVTGALNSYARITELEAWTQ